MGSDVTKAYGAEKRSDLFWFDPDKLTVVDDETHALHDPYRIVEQPSEAFVANIVELGVEEPIIVRLNGKTKAGVPIIEVADGRQRTLGARMANKILKKKGHRPLLVPAVAKKGDDVFMLKTMIALNEHRKEDSMLARAKKAQRLINLGEDVDSCALTFGVTTNTIRTWLKLLDCGDDIQKAVHNGVIRPSIATKLVEMPRAEQTKALAEMLATGATKGASATAAIRRISAVDIEASGSTSPGSTSTASAGTKKRAARSVDDGDAIELVPSKPALKKFRDAITEGIEADKWSEENTLIAKTVAQTIAFFLDGEKLPSVAANVYKKVAEQVREKRQQAAKRAFEKRAALAAAGTTPSAEQEDSTGEESNYPDPDDVGSVDGDGDDDGDEGEDMEAIAGMAADVDADDADHAARVAATVAARCSVCKGVGFLGDKVGQDVCTACDGEGTSEAQAKIAAGDTFGDAHAGDGGDADAEAGAAAEES